MNNILGYCSIKDDDFNKFKDKFLKSDAIILSSPVYYHYITGQMKVLIDRFRSTFYVKITPEGLEHTFIYEKGKTFLFILTLGHPEITDALPAIESLKLWVKTTCKNPVILKPIIATFLALPNQINASKEKLEKSTSAEDYNNAADELAKRAQKLGEILYKNMQEQQGSEGAQGFNPEDFAQQNNQNTQQKPGNDGPIDADYEVVDDK